MGQLYVNGVFDTQLVLKGNVLFNNGPFLVGKDLEGAGAKMYLDDLRVYSTSVSETQLHAIAGRSLAVGPQYVRLGCKSRPCSLNDAMVSCPKEFHLCSVKELYS